ncbi:uncharacterized protein BT62DRAFT_930437 [Guyanagaster necrorhizus]|uniref:Uncharacterized protein n=1 Tax=Guyanagaster necrorhizus TaxID=856835 RepID=A0A9P7VXG8_9AGAR|nr:uncharacterized protein BT62DRAFT_930437 [Guyanagaster necrorhizus MCA 3950]KAG7448362.1 hypothetical protein BT62DRAFT_930437 [Guyanagaster necrorhizus MCA 3950]
MSGCSCAVKNAVKPYVLRITRPGRLDYSKSSRPRRDGISPLAEELCIRPYALFYGHPTIHRVTPSIPNPRMLHRRTGICSSGPMCCPISIVLCPTIGFSCTSHGAAGWCTSAAFGTILGLYTVPMKMPKVSVSDGGSIVPCLL